MKEEERAWALVQRLLALRPRTKVELHRRLASRGFSQGVIQGVLARAEEAGLVDDEKFARLFAEDRLLSRPCPRRRVSAELQARGIDPRLAEEASRSVLPDLTEEELARKALEKAQHRFLGLPREVALRRAYAFLLRRGFPPGLSRPLVEEAFGPWPSASESA